VGPFSIMAFRFTDGDGSIGARQQHVQKIQIAKYVA
jgi:hypothetical protein